MLLGERKRRNRDRAALAWAVSYIIAPHVDSKHSGSISTRRLLMGGVPGYDPDPEDLDGE